jgi:hypothetical protein
VTLAKIADIDNPHTDHAAHSLVPSSITPLEADWVSPDIETWWLPSPIREWCEAMATACGVPAIMPVSAALCALAAATQGKVQVRFNPKWTEPTSLYWFVFSPPDMRKSTVLGPAIKPLRDLQTIAAREAAEQRKLNEGPVKALEAEMKRKIAQMSKASEDNDGDWTGKKRQLRDELVQLRLDIVALEVPPAPYLVLDDINPAILPKALASNLASSRGVAATAIVDDEGTFIENMLGRSTGHVNIELLTKAYVGGSVAHIRASQNSDGLVASILDQAYLTLCIFAQPRFLATLRETQRLNDQGLLGRCLLTNVPSCVEPPWDAPAVPESLQAAYAAAVQGLYLEEHDEVIDLCDAAPWREYYEAIPRGIGPQGWAGRVLGRVARIEALCRLVESIQGKGLAGHLAGIARSACAAQGVSGSENLGSRGIKRIEYLYTYLIRKDSKGLDTLAGGSAAATGSQAGTTTDPRRLLVHLLNSGRTAGDRVTFAYLRRYSPVRSKEACSAAVADLLSSGHFVEFSPEKRFGGLVLRGEYVIRSLDPEAGTSAPKAPPAPPVELPRKKAPVPF